MPAASGVRRGTPGDCGGGRDGEDGGGDVKGVGGAQPGQGAELMGLGIELMVFLVCRMKGGGVEDYDVQL